MKDSLMTHCPFISYTSASTVKVTHFCLSGTKTFAFLKQAAFNGSVCHVAVEIFVPSSAGKNEFIQRISRSAFSVEPCRYPSSAECQPTVALAVAGRVQGCQADGRFVFEQVSAGRREGGSYVLLSESRCVALR